MESQHPPAQPLTLTQWLIVSVAALGFAFDIYELLMMPLIAGPALAELLKVPPGDPLITKWIGYIFWGSAFFGGGFGLIGGYLTDRFGRRRVLLWSILIYAFSALAAGFATTPWMLLLLRCTTFMGVCVEFVAAVAWLAELFPNPRQREQVLGYTQAFSSIGGLLVTAVAALIVKYAEHLPAIYGDHAPWRYTLMSGVFPALPLIFIRPFLPESPVWQQKATAGQLKRPSFGELFQPALRRTTLVTTILFACSYAAAFGALQLTPTQIVPGLPGPDQKQAEVDALKKQMGGLMKEASALPADSSERKALLAEAGKLRPQIAKLTASVRQLGNGVQSSQEFGGLFGRFLLAFLAVRIASRQTLLRLFQLPGLLVIPLVYFLTASGNLGLTGLTIGIFFAGLFTVGQFSFWGNYLPRVYPVHLRGTGESFAANVGGRMIGTSAAFVTTSLVAPLMPVENNFHKVAYAAGAVTLAVFALGLIISFWLPEPSSDVDSE